ncbi:MAG: hypothetical protein ACTSXF_14510, partial [Promethearchaeota archaeon]
IKIPIDIIYNENFPNEPPEISFREDPSVIENFPTEIELTTLGTWTPESKVIDIIMELHNIIKSALEGPVNKEEGKVGSGPESELGTIPLSEGDNGADIGSNMNTTENIDTNVSQGTGYAQENTPPPAPQNVSPASEGTNYAGDAMINNNEEYITPDPTQYQYDDLNYDASSYPEWSEEDLNQQQPTNDQPIAENNYAEGNYAEGSYTEEKEPPDLTLSTEAALLQQEYAMDYVDSSISKVEIYLTITIEQTFIIIIDFSNYPKRPIIELPEGVKSILGDVNTSLDTLKKWKESNPPHIVDIVRELERKLWFLSDLETEAKMITGEYKTEMINGILSKLRITLLTYGFKEYTVDVDFTKFPSPPNIKYSKELEELIKVPVETLKAYRNWKRKESHVVDIIREISWLVDKNSRINFELALLRGGSIKEVEYNQDENSLHAKIAGQMKTKDLSFEFLVKLPEDYPMSAPKIELLTDLEAQEDIKTKLTNQINTFVSSWNPFNYLMDLFNEISKAIFAVSVVSCVICHKIECPTCGKPISAPNPEDQCQVMCPSCERLYHKHCWDQTIRSFGKCGFCLRPPPPDLMPKD